MNAAGNRSPKGSEDVNLAGIRERNTTASTYDTWHLVGRDVSRLLVAVEAALKAVDEAEEVRDYSGPETHGRLVGWDLDPAKLREAISSALTGKDAT